jgi:catechol 2,3-dioxygenase-like lactoylglutathione lyase family enzyme
MFSTSQAFSGLSVNDIEAAHKFYGETLGLPVEQNPQGLEVHLASGSHVFIYPKPDHQPATYTALYFPVDDIDRAVNELKAKGVAFENYPEMTDSNNIARGRAAGQGPDIAWFKDPAGNFLAVLTNTSS